MITTLAAGGIHLAQISTVVTLIVGLGSIAAALIRLVGNVRRLVDAMCQAIIDAHERITKIEGELWGSSPKRGQQQQPRRRGTG